jgi:hypothetical protein
MSPLPLAITLALANLTTVAEESGWKRTGRLEEVARLCEAFPRAYPKRVRCTTFGVSPEGRPMHVIIAGEGKGKPVVLIQAGIHAGEIDGKDAGFLALRELLDGKLLDRVTVVFVPVFNVDGHERFGAHHRPNQNGPEEMGWRVTAHNLNLNRDYAKADAPEMAAMLRLLNQWDPILYLDLHVTDGAQFQHDIATLVEPVERDPEPLNRAARGLRDAVVLNLTAQGHLPLGEFYPSFLKEDDPTGGFAAFAAPPRFSTAYWAVRNRLAILVETHSWKPYAARVKATHDTLIAAVTLAAERGGEWRLVARAADEEAARLGGKKVVLAWQPGGEPRTISFLGYAYTQTPSTVSGKVRIQYDPTKPAVWRVPFFDKPKPVLEVVAPRAGYLVPPAWAALVGDKLKLHGVRYQVLGASAAVEQEQFRATEVTLPRTTYEGRTPVTLKGAWAKARAPIAAGTLFVPMSQPGARLAMHLLEPQAPDSLAAWGFMNAVFEQKEYMEPYVAEDVALELLKQKPIKDAFEQKLASDPAFAKSPQARLDFFYRLHPSWDAKLNLYPVTRTDTVPR